jgi:hypothetical protein
LLHKPQDNPFQLLFFFVLLFLSHFFDFFTQSKDKQVPIRTGKLERKEQARNEFR